MIDLKIKTTDAQLKKEIKKEVNKTLKRNFNIKKLKLGIQEVLAKAIIAHPTWGALSSGGKLAIDFGIRRGEEENRKADIMTAILDSIEVRITTGAKVHIKVDGIDYDSLLASPAGKTESKGQTLPWLEWLLFYGDREIIEGYRVQYGNTPNNTSRSGGAIMVQSLSSFKVDPEYAGFRDNNFLTQSIEQLYNNKIIDNLFVELINDAFK